MRNKLFLHREIVDDEPNRERGFDSRRTAWSKTRGREREKEGKREKGRECDSWIVVCGIALKSVVRECERQTAWNETAKKEAARFFSGRRAERERAGEAESRDYFGIGQR